MIAQMFVIFVVCFWQAISHTDSGLTLHVNTTIGEIQGRYLITDINGTETKVSAFLGIPYAEPPTGDGRFKPPEKKRYLLKTLNAAEVGPACPQNMAWVINIPPPFSYMGTPRIDEDCLTLNIYVPEVVTENSSAAVMVWFHGGAYAKGSANMYDGRTLATVGQVIIVTVNYRLGVLGFLATGGHNAVGNYGLWDQVMALKWIQGNIALFGGDPKKVTIFGHSSGSAGVTLLTLSPKAHGLYNRVIAESGTAFAPWATTGNPKSWFNRFATSVGCVEVSESAILKCLKMKTVKEIVTAQDKTPLGAWAPNFDRDFFPVNLNRKSLEDSTDTSLLRACAGVDIMLGVNSQEGIGSYEKMMAPYRTKQHINDTVNGMPAQLYEDFVEQLASEIVPKNQATYIRIMKTILNRYTEFELPQTGLERSLRYITLQTDYLFLADAISFVSFHSGLRNATDPDDEAGKTYFYYYDNIASWMPAPPWRTGAGNGDEVYSVFGLTYNLSGSTQAEKDFSTVIMTFWSNFAKSGNPNVPVRTQFPVDWPQYTSGEEKYVHFKTGSSAGDLIRTKFFPKRDEFWNDYFPKIKVAMSLHTEPPYCPDKKRRANTAPSIGMNRVKALVLICSCLVFAATLFKY